MQSTPDAASIASALNWPSGRVPGATVIIQRLTDAGPAFADTLTTDSAGEIDASGLQSGRYSLHAKRTLTGTERAALPPSVADVFGFEGASKVTLGSSGTFSVQAYALARGSLVISEIYPGEPFLATNYPWGQYIELYNNSDTTIQLAGKLIFPPAPSPYDFPTYGCHAWDGIVRDPAGLWARHIYRFPAGSQALRPGDVTVIATDAINHREVKNDVMFYDLSASAFEFRGSADVDNPLALDMISIGPQNNVPAHGWITQQQRDAIALAMPLDIATLPQKRDSIWGDVARIPNAAILDVVQFKYKVGAPPDAECLTSTLPPLDAEEASVLGDKYHEPQAMHRKNGGLTAAGRVFLQRSKNSALDFVARLGSPGTVPD